MSLDSVQFWVLLYEGGQSWCSSNENASTSIYTPTHIGVSCVSSTHTECVVWVEPTCISVWVYNLRCGSRLIGSPKCPTQKCLCKWFRNAVFYMKHMQFFCVLCNRLCSSTSTESTINNGKSRNFFCQFVHYLAGPRFVNSHFFCHALVVPPVVFCLYGFALDILECFPPFVIRSTG